MDQNHAAATQPELVTLQRYCSRPHKIRFGYILFGKMETTVDPKTCVVVQGFRPCTQNLPAGAPANITHPSTCPCLAYGIAPDQSINHQQATLRFDVAPHSTSQRLLLTVLRHAPRHPPSPSPSTAVQRCRSTDVVYNQCQLSHLPVSSGTDSQPQHPSRSSTGCDLKIFVCCAV